MTKTFRTGEILAAMYGSPAMIAARENIGIGAAWRRLIDISPGIAGATAPDWLDLAQSLSPVLAKFFTALAAEERPDREYWANITTPDPDPAKVKALGDWVRQMEAKYGATQEVPDLSAEVIADMDKNRRERDAAAGRALQWLGRQGWSNTGP